MRYVVKTLREAGLEAKWSRTSSGGPILVARDPNAKADHMRKRWWYVDKQMWDSMKKTSIQDGFESWTILGDLFSI